MSSPHTIPPPLPSLDAAEFRRKLAGLPSQVRASQFRGLKDAAVDVAYAMAVVFNRDKLEPTTLWERIATGIDSAADRVDDGDMDVFLGVCFEHVCADMTRVACSEEVQNIISHIIQQDLAWRVAFVRYLKQIKFTIIPLARLRWEARKEANKS